MEHENKIKYIIGNSYREINGLKLVPLEISEECTYNFPKENTAMNYTINLEVKQRDYLSSRAYRIQTNKESELYRQFGIWENEPPKTRNELMQRIKDGKFVIRRNEDEDYDDDDSCNFFSTNVIWRDPEVKKDFEGLETAKKTLTSYYTSVIDTVTIKSLDEGLKAVEAFEKWTYKN